MASKSVSKKILVYKLGRLITGAYFYGLEFVLSSLSYGKQSLDGLLFLQGAFSFNNRGDRDLTRPFGSGPEGKMKYQLQV